MRLNYNTVYSGYVAVGGVQAMVLRYKWEHDISGDCHEPTSESIFWCVFSNNGAFVFKHIGNKAFNTPQPLDQWTNSPFIGQQVGNCKSFTLTHYLANLFAKHHGPRSIPLCIQHHIQFTSLSFQVSRPSHSEIKQLQYFSLKIEGQGHGRGEHWKSQHGSNILLTHIPFVTCQSAIRFIRYDFFKIQPWKSKVKVMGEGKVESHNMGPTFYRLTYLSFHINPPSHSWYKTFSKFDLSWKSKVKVMVKIKVESHKVGVTSYRLTSLLFHVISKVKVMGEEDIESHNMGPTFYWLTCL